MFSLIVIDVVFFFSLLFSYLFFRFGMDNLQYRPDYADALKEEASSMNSRLRKKTRYLFRFLFILSLCLFFFSIDFLFLFFFRVDYSPSTTSLLSPRLSGSRDSYQLSHSSESKVDTHGFMTPPPSPFKTAQQIKNSPTKQIPQKYLLNFSFWFDWF